MNSDALLLARNIIEYFDDAEEHFMYRWEQDAIKRLAYKVQQQEEMRLWNI